MKCSGCGAASPYLVESGPSYDCIYCSNGKQYVDAVDLLTEPSLKFVHETRDGQIKMAEEISQSFTDAVPTLFEAGTGVGKSFAYLLPAILSGKRVIISTAKIALQNQLITKDLPRIRDYLLSIQHPRMTFAYAAAYGRSNYACYVSCENTYGKTNHWQEYAKFFKESTYGHWDDAERLHLKLDRNQNATECIGRECRHSKHCGYLADRQRMLMANVVVTNNWLLGYHYRLQRKIPNFKLLGDFDHIIVDEAHKIEDGIRAAFTNETSLQQLELLKNKVHKLNEICTGPGLAVPALFSADSLWKATFESLSSDNKRHAGVLSQRTEDTLRSLLGKLTDVNTQLLDRTTFETVFRVYNAAVHRDFISRWLQKPEGSAGTDQVNRALPSTAGDQDNYLALDKVFESLHSAIDTFEDILNPKPNTTWTIETSVFKGKTHVYLKSMPVNIGGFLPDKAITYVSATLALDDKFDTFASRVGLRNKTYRSDIFPSPFNIKKQAFLYIPNKTTMPEPTSAPGPARDTYRDTLAKQIYELIYASRGDAFVLFTSREELEHVRQYLNNQAYPYPVIAQGQFSPSEALAKYRNTKHATLLGLKSFWEGVDVSGDKLFLVIITKLPFPTPDDPIIRARVASYDDSDMAFRYVTMADMLFDLRQGVGRLIRTQTDRGILAILDSRVHSKRYGARVIHAIGLKPYVDLATICRGLATRHAE